MTKIRNKKKHSKDETPYSPFGQQSPSRGKKDGHNDAKVFAADKKILPVSKKTERQSMDKMNVDSLKPKTPEQMNVDSSNPLEQVKAEPTPATYPSSIDRTKYAAIIDLISTEKCQATDNWKYVNRDEFGPNAPFLR
jgi:hypothetical protein